MAPLPTVIEYLEQQFTTRKKTNNMVNDMDSIFHNAGNLVLKGELSHSDAHKTMEVMMRLYSDELDNATSSSRMDRRNALKQRLASCIKSVARK
jgi:hypothetical protein